MKKKRNWFLRLLFVLFIVFLGLYIASVSGYYETQVGNKVALTEEAIRDFENDVLEGKNVDIKTYLQEDNKDYSNTFTDMGDRFSESVQKILTDGIGGIWDAIKVLFFLKIYCIIVAGVVKWNKQKFEIFP